MHASNVFSYNSVNFGILKSAPSSNNKVVKHKHKLGHLGILAQACINFCYEYNFINNSNLIAKNYNPEFSSLKKKIKPTQNIIYPNLLLTSHEINENICKINGLNYNEMQTHETNIKEEIFVGNLQAKKSFKVTTINSKSVTSNKNKRLKSNKYDNYRFSPYSRTFHSFKPIKIFKQGFSNSILTDLNQALQSSFNNSFKTNYITTPQSNDINENSVNFTSRQIEMEFNKIFSGVLTNMEYTNKDENLNFKLNATKELYGNLNHYYRIKSILNEN